MKTIEEDLMTALLKAGLISEEAFNTPQLIQFQRAARTDKGVSAARQVVSIKLRELCRFSYRHYVVGYPNNIQEPQFHNFQEVCNSDIL